MNANLMTKKIEMTKSEAKEAGKLNTEKFHELRQYMAIYPGFEVQIKAPSKRKVELRGLDYKYMRIMLSRTVELSRLMGRDTSNLLEIA